MSKNGFSASTFRRNVAARLVHADEVANAIVLGMEAEKNVLLYGPAGHAKSAMVKQLNRTLEVPAFEFNCSEGTTVDALYGGVDLRALKEENVLRYNTSNSFLAAPSSVVVFEEFLDAPPTVLASLKATLTAREFVNGFQRVEMKPRVVIALTNKTPSEISELGPSAHALMERFPIQVEVKWPSYTADDFHLMFEKLAKADPSRGIGSMARPLAEVIAKACESGHFVSPRTAVHAMDLVRATAGGRVPEKSDLLAIRFLAGLDQMVKTLEKEIEEAHARAEAEARLLDIGERARALQFASKFEAAKALSTPIKALQHVVRCNALVEELGSLRLPDAMIKSRNNISNALLSAASMAQAMALELTRVG